MSVDDLDQREFAVAELDAPRKGTLATAEVDLSNVRDLRALFDAYTDDCEFSKTRVVVIKLFAHGVRFISRSEAKRLLLDLERFREVVLDFSGVEAVGQGFADEVFVPVRRPLAPERTNPVRRQCHPSLSAYLAFGDSPGAERVRGLAEPRSPLRK